MRKIARWTLLTIVICGYLTACDTTSTIDTNFAGAGSVLVITSDWTTGSYATVDRETSAVTSDIALIHSDATCAYSPVIDVPFIVQRLNGDAVIVLDPNNGFAITSEYSVEAGSNPYDIAVVSPDRAYVSRYSSAEMLVVHPTQGTVLGTVDLSAYADADGIPEMAYMFHHGNAVYVAVQRLNSVFEPADQGLIVVLNAQTGAVEKEIFLTSSNPSTRLRFSEAFGKLVIVETGSYQTLDDGGLELLDLSDHSLSGFLITENDLGGNITDAVIASESKGYAIIGIVNGVQVASHLVSFNPTTGQKLTDLLVSDTWAYNALELTPDNQQLWLADGTFSNPGIRIFDVATDQEISNGPISVNLPPTAICFVESQYHR